MILPVSVYDYTQEFSPAITPFYFEEEDKNFIDLDFQQKSQERISEATDATRVILGNLSKIADKEAWEKRTASNLTLRGGPSEGGDGLSNEENRLAQPYQRENHYYTTPHSPAPSFNLIELAKTVLLGIGAVFLGAQAYQSYRENRNSQHLPTLSKSLNDCRAAWEDCLSLFFKKEYKIRVLEACKQAQMLIEEKQSNNSHNFYLKIMLVASGAFTALSIVFKTAPAYPIAGALMCTMTALFMVARYGSSSFTQARLATDLKNRVEAAERELEDNLLSPLEISKQFG